MGRHFFPFIATLGIYILVCNFLKYQRRTCDTGISCHSHIRIKRT
jgi:hypothetical protein